MKSLAQAEQETLLQKLENYERQRDNESVSVEASLQEIADEFNSELSTVKKMYYKQVKRNFEDVLKPKTILNVDQTPVPVLLFNEVLVIDLKAALNAIHVKTDHKLISEKLLLSDTSPVQYYFNDSIINSDSYPLRKIVTLFSVIREEITQLETRKKINEFFKSIFYAGYGKYLDHQKADIEYRKDDYMLAEVVYFTEYGAMLEILDGSNRVGLLHNSEITDKKFRSDATEYFKLNQKILVSFVSRKRDTSKGVDRYSFTTKGLDYPTIKNTETSNEGFEVDINQTQQRDSEHGNINNKGVSKVLKLEIENFNEQDELLVKSNPKTLDIPSDDELDFSDDELNEFFESKEGVSIIKALNSHIGVLSPDAKKELYRIVKREDIFKFGFAMASVLPDFNCDLGLIFLKEINSHITRSCL